MALPKSRPVAPPEAEIRREEEWLAVELLIGEVCRGLCAALPGVPTVVDCTPGLEVPAAESSRLCRSVARLVVRTAAGVGTGGLEVAARAAGSPAAPALLFAVQAISKERRTIRGGTGLDAEELALGRELIERGGGRLLITRQLLGERRSMLGVGARWRIGRTGARILRPRPEAERVRGDQPADVSSSEVEPVPLRYAAAEMPYSLSRW